ncbi:MAG: hypothetical protein MOGMAGMI_01842 [Candidatus Omnitrophica bacterium]|nr:hypothetical protein [Candidatus Omnitrophota bacterium]
MISHSSFINKYLGRYAEFPNTGSAINQCMDIMRFYIRDVWGVDPYVIPRSATAKQAYLNFRTNNNILKIPNTPNGIPKKGDIIFFGTLWPFTGLAGHVGIVESADLYNVTVFHQNYPTGTPCTYKKFKYTYYGLPFVMGWIRKR